MGGSLLFSVCLLITILFSVYDSSDSWPSKRKTEGKMKMKVKAKKNNKRRSIDVRDA